MADLSVDPVRVSTLVNAELATTFRLFTEETDAWWKRGARYRVAGSHHGTLHLEPRVHGRLFESFDSGGVTRVVRIGRVQVWEAPARIVFDWRAVHCAPHELSEVEVTFARNENSTQITLTHRGWNALSADHPARRALDPIRVFWDELLRSLADFAK